MDMQNFIATIQEHALGVVAAILILVIGFPIANYIGKMVAKAIAKQKIDPALNKFFQSIVKMLLKILVIISAAGVAGIEIASFVAVIGAMAFAIGLAFQGSLSNFAGGVLLLMMRPINIGDFIEASGETGTVDEIGIIYTKLHTLDNRVVVIPNGTLANGNIINYTAEKVRRVDLSFGASYNAPVDKVKAAIESVIKAHDKVLDSPQPFVRLGAHSASSLDYTVRVWTKTEYYWDVHFDLMEQVKAKFDAEGIEIPFNQLDVHVNQ